MDDKKWFREHLEAIKEKYQGKLVSVLNGEIVAVGDSLDDIRKIIFAKKKRGEIRGIPFTGKADDDIAVAHLPPVVI
jgi:hypothetical protein